MVHGALPSAVQGLASTDAISGIVGFFAGSAIALVWKLIRDYE
tara:strand:- start:268 stop:396 length:129 start_codon:yes stop_codon:yes gene_type:complete